MNLYERHHAIQSRDDFVAFVQALSEDLQANRKSWENDKLEAFLDALGAWVNDMDAYYINQGKQVPQQLNWKILGDILLGAKIYE